MRPDIDILRTRLEQAIRSAVTNIVTTTDPRRNQERVRATLVHSVHSILHAAQDSGNLSNFSVTVDPIDAVRLGDRNIPIDALPGDRIGSSGIVVSSDGNGRGIVLDPLAPESEPDHVRLCVSLKPACHVDSIVLNFEVSDIAH